MVGKSRHLSSDEKARILIVASNPLGGIRSYMLNNMSWLKKQGYCFTFLAPAGEAFDTFKRDVADWPDAEFVEVDFKRGESMWKAIRQTLKQRRFAIIHSQGLRAGTEASLSNLGLGIPHIITLHDVILPQNDIPGRFKWLKKRIAAWLTSRANVVVPVSHDCANNHLQHFPKWNRGKVSIQVISNGVDIERLQCVAESIDRRRLRDAWSVAEDTVILGFFGRFMPQKGFLTLLNALRELERRGLGDRLCLVTAKDPYGYRNEYIAEVEQDPRLSRMVRFVDPVSDIATLLPAIDVLAMPSLWEACPLLPMEAMVLGVPVVGSDAIGLREVLANTPSSTPPSGNASLLADAIEASLDARSCDAARTFAPDACRRFDHRCGAEQLCVIYDELSGRTINHGQRTELETVKPATAVELAAHNANSSRL